MKTLTTKPVKHTNPNYKILYDLIEREKKAKVVEKIKEKYQKFETGEIPPNDFKNYLANDLKLTITPKLNHIIESPAADQKNLTSILKNIDFLKTEETPFAKVNYDNKFNKHKRRLNQPQCKLDESDPYYDIKVWSLKLVRGNISPNAFRTFLLEKNINPNIEEINKHIRAHENSKVDYKDLMYSIMRYKDSNTDPTQINFDIKPMTHYKTTLESDNGKSLTYKKGSSQPKKDITCRYNSFNSNKECFDWEANALVSLKIGEVPQTAKNNRKNKIVFESHVFDEDFNKEDMMRKQPHRSSTSYHRDNGDIFRWTQEKDNFASQKSKQPVRKFDPNSKKQEAEKPSKKKNLSMFQSSSENFLNNNIIEAK